MHPKKFFQLGHTTQTVVPYCWVALYLSCYLQIEEVVQDVWICWEHKSRRVFVVEAIHPILLFGHANRGTTLFLRC